MDLKAWNQKLVTKVTDLENEKAELQSGLEQMQLLNKFKNTDFIKERDELHGEISELQLLVEDLKAQVRKTGDRRKSSLAYFPELWNKCIVYTTSFRRLSVNAQIGLAFHWCLYDK